MGADNTFGETNFKPQHSTNTVLAAGFPTHSVDITGKRICLGDEVTYDFDDEHSKFIVVFEDNAFRKKYKRWDKTLEKPLLEYGEIAKQMRLKIVRGACR